MTGTCWYLIISASVCTAVSLLELLDRYSHAARFQDVVVNIPGVAYLALNFIVGAVAVPIATSSGVVELAHANGEVIFGSAIKAVLIGFGALGVLRSSFANLGGTDGQHQVGFAVFLDRLKAYLDRKIALKHKMILDDAIVPAMKDVPAASLQFDLPTICIAGMKCRKEEIDDVRAVVTSAFQQPLSNTARKLLIGHAICQLCGIDILRASVAQMLKMDKETVSDHDTQKEASLTSDLQSQLDRLLKKGA